MRMEVECMHRTPSSALPSGYRYRTSDASDLEFACRVLLLYAAGFVMYRRSDGESLMVTDGGFSRQEAAGRVESSFHAALETS